MIWTHFYDLILKLGILFLSIFIFIQIPFIEERGVLLFVLVLLISVGSYILFLRTLGSWLYSRLTLKMKVNFQQAKSLNAALAPINQIGYYSKWLPLKEVQNFPSDQKYLAAQQMIQNWQQENKREAEQKNLSKPSIKKLEIVAAILVILSIVLSYLQLLPASYLIELYLYVFQTDRYPPVLIGIILIFLFFIPYILWLKIKKKK